MKKRPVILVADDDKRIRDMLSDILLVKRNKVVEAVNGSEALEKVKSESPDVILLDINMPGLSGIEVIKKLKEDRESGIIPIVVISGEDDFGVRVQALKLGADDFLTKPFHADELTARVNSLIKVKAYNDYMQSYQSILEQEVHERTKALNDAHKKLQDASLDTIYRLSRAAEYKDEDTSVHIQRMSHYSAAIARKIGFDDDEVEALLYASPMHDIGKIGIPDRILLKPGKLDAEEWDIMRQHTEFGARILENAESYLIQMGKTIAHTHHEKWDGLGYPEGLKGNNIPVEGRITAVADVFDALTSKRPYKKALSNARAFCIIADGKGSHFDPDLVEAFFDIKDEILEIQNNFVDDGKSVFIDLAGDVQ